LTLLDLDKIQFSVKKTNARFLGGRSSMDVEPQGKNAVKLREDGTKKTSTSDGGIPPQKENGLMFKWLEDEEIQEFPHKVRTGREFH
jgi:hypothetical protein